MQTCIKFHMYVHVRRARVVCVCVCVCVCVRACVRARVRALGVRAKRSADAGMRGCTSGTRPNSRSIDTTVLPLPLALRFVEHVVDAVHIHNDTPQHGLVAISYAIDLAVAECDVRASE
jgi:hypothetical protein